MARVSYCATHNTFPEQGEPCWQCANPFINAAYEVGLEHRGLSAGFCPYCHHSLKDNGHGVDQNDFSGVQYLSTCMYCKQCQSRKGD